MGRDELTTLATTFNGMLANLENAYQQQKRFIADASHELRAPITSISCNLDLLVRAPDLPCTEREATLLDARSEAERMGRLVNDLLTLARADEIADTREKPRAASPQTSAGTLPRVDLDSLVLGVFRQYRSTSEQHDEASMPRLVLQHIMPAQVYGDTDQLKQGGSGLGLAIVQSIVQEHRGRIDVESTPGKGSAFSIRLPIIESTF
jgi:signal transduction histidine kinase